MDLPKVKKKIKDFLIGEKGSISKKALINTGMALFIGSQMVNATQTSTISPDCPAIAISYTPNNVPNSGVAGHSNNTQTSSLHSNGIGISKLSNDITGSHSHCVDTHTNHGSHSSHGSHGSHGSGW